MKGNPATTIHTRGRPRLKVLRAYKNLLLLDGRCHFQFDYIFLGPGTIIFQVPPGNYQGAPQFFNFLWPPAMFLTVPIQLPS